MLPVKVPTLASYRSRRAPWMGSGGVVFSSCLGRVRFLRARKGEVSVLRALLLLRDRSIDSAFGFQRLIFMRLFAGLAPLGLDRLGGSPQACGDLLEGAMLSGHLDGSRGLVRDPGARQGDRDGQVGVDRGRRLDGHRRGV